MSENIIVRELKATDDLEKAAELFYESGSKMYELVFGDKATAITYLSKLIREENNIYSHKTCIVAFKNQQICGLVSSYNKDNINNAEMGKDFMKVLKFFNMMKLFISSRKIKELDDFSDVDGYYVQAVCVDEDYRKMGIASKLLEYCFNKQKENLYLDVEADNYNAIALYNKYGFKKIRDINVKYTNSPYIRMKKCG